MYAYHAAQPSTTVGLSGILRTLLQATSVMAGHDVDLLGVLYSPAIVLYFVVSTLCLVSMSYDCGRCLDVWSV